MLRRVCLFLLLPGALCLNAQAQLATVRGVVVDVDTELPLAGVNVVLVSAAEGTRGMATDSAGRFAFGGIRPGVYVLTASHVGYSPHVDSLQVEFGRDLTLDVGLEPTHERLDELVVEVDHLPDVEALGAGHLQIRPMALQRVPMPDVSADLAAYLTTRPGVVTAGDRGGQLFVRGGTPTQNLVLLDGMRLFQPFHIVGFYSVFPADIIAEADFFAGGFSARYGGRISSVIDVATRNGSKHRVGGAVSIAPFLASVNAEFPLVPEKVSVLGSARESIIERISPGLLGERLPYRFGDRFLKVHAYLSRTSSFSATLLHSFDEGDVAGFEDSERVSTWRNTAFGGRYLYLPPDYPVITELSVFGTFYSSRFLPSDDVERTSDVTSANAEIRFAYLLGPLQMHFGLATSTNQMAYDLGRRASTVRESVTEGSFYFSTSWDVGSVLHLEPGLRYQSYSSGNGSGLEPRFRMSWRPFSGSTLSGAWGIYHQQFLGLQNQRDVTDAFIAWVPIPDNSPLPRSDHVIVGWQQEIGRFLQVGVEGYRKNVQNVLFPLSGDEIATTAELDRVDGVARGLDFIVDFTRPYLYLHAGYSLSAVEYSHTELHPVVRPTTDGGLITDFEALTERFSPPHDRRHQVNLLARVSGGPYSASIRWQFGSGLPYSRIHGYYDSARPASPEDLGFLLDAGNPEVAFAEPYSSRLPTYHRLDFSAERSFTFRTWRLILQAGAINVYDRANIFSYDLLLGRRVDQLPLIPSLGLRVEVI